MRLPRPRGGGHDERLPTTEQPGLLCRELVLAESARITELHELGQLVAH